MEIKRGLSYLIEGFFEVTLWSIACVSVTAQVDLLSVD